MSAAQALAYAQAHMPPFTAQQVAFLQNLANDEAQLGGLPLMPPLWFHGIVEDIENPDDDWDWEEEEEDDPDATVVGEAEELSQYGDSADEEEVSEEEDTPKKKGKGKRMVRMPYDEFVKEHKHLLDVLSKGDRKSLREEYESQKAELGRHGRM